MDFNIYNDKIYYEDFDVNLKDILINNGYKVEYIVEDNKLLNERMNLSEALERIENKTLGNRALSFQANNSNISILVTDNELAFAEKRDLRLENNTKRESDLTRENFYKNNNLATDLDTFEKFSEKYRSNLFIPIDLKDDYKFDDSENAKIYFDSDFKDFLSTVLEFSTNKENANENTLQVRMFRAFGIYFSNTNDKNLSDNENNNILQSMGENKFFLDKDRQELTWRENDKSLYTNSLPLIFEAATGYDYSSFFKSIEKDLNISFKTLDDVEKNQDVLAKAFSDPDKYLHNTKMDYINNKVSSLFRGEYRNAIAEKTLENLDKDISSQRLAQTDIKSYIKFFNDNTDIKLGLKNLPTNENISVLTINNLMSNIYVRDEKDIYSFDLSSYDSLNNYTELFIELANNTVDLNNSKTLKRIDDRAFLKEFSYSLNKLQQSTGVNLVTYSNSSPVVNLLAKIDKNTPSQSFNKKLDDIKNAYIPDVSRINWKDNNITSENAMATNLNNNLNKRTSDYGTKRVTVNTYVKSNKDFYDTEKYIDNARFGLGASALKSIMSSCTLKENDIIYNSKANLSYDLKKYVYNNIFQFTDTYGKSPLDMFKEIYGDVWDYDRHKIEQDVWKFEKTGTLYNFKEGKREPWMNSALGVYCHSKGIQLENMFRSDEKMLNYLENTNPQLKVIWEKAMEFEKQNAQALETYNSYRNKIGDFKKIRENNLGTQTSLGFFNGNLLVKNIQKEYAKNSKVVINKEKDNDLFSALMNTIDFYKVAGSAAERDNIIKQLQGKTSLQAFDERQFNKEKEFNEVDDKVNTYFDVIEKYQKITERPLTDYQMGLLLLEISKVRSMSGYRMSNNDMNLTVNQIRTIDTRSGRDSSKNFNKSQLLYAREIGYSSRYLSDKNTDNFLMDSATKAVKDYLIEKRKIPGTILKEVNKNNPIIKASVNPSTNEPYMITEVTDLYSNVQMQQEQRNISNKIYCQKSFRTNDGQKYISYDQYHSLDEAGKKDFHLYLSPFSRITEKQYNSLSDSDKERYQIGVKSKKEQFNKNINEKIDKLKGSKVSSRLPSGVVKSWVGNSLEDYSPEKRKAHEYTIITEATIDALSALSFCKIDSRYDYMRDLNLNDSQDIKDNLYNPYRDNLQNSLKDIDLKQDKVNFVSILGVGNARNLDLRDYCFHNNIDPSHVILMLDNDQAGTQARLKLENQLPTVKSIVVDSKNGIKDVNEMLQYKLKELNESGLDVDFESGLIKNKNTNEVVKTNEELLFRIGKYEFNESLHDSKALQNEPKNIVDLSSKFLAQLYNSKELNLESVPNQMQMFKVRMAILQEIKNELSEIEDSGTYKFLDDKKDNLKNNTLKESLNKIFDDVLNEFKENREEKAKEKEQQVEEKAIEENVENIKEKVDIGNTAEREVEEEMEM